MNIIGERINGQFTDVEEAIQEKDKTVIQDLAKKQVECGADYLDVNVGTSVPSHEREDAMLWLIDSIKEVVDAPLCLDSPRQPVIEAGLERVEKPPIINSCQADLEELETYMNMAMEYDAGLIALTMDKDGVPNDAEKRVALAGNIVMKARELDFDFDNLFIDPIVLPVSATQTQPGFLLEAMQQMQNLSDPLPHFNVGLSNISSNTKENELINRTYMVMCIAHGVDTAIVNPMDEELMDAIITAEILLNKHIYNDDYLSAYRSSK